MNVFLYALLFDRSHFYSFSYVHFGKFLAPGKSFLSLFSEKTLDMSKEQFEIFIKFTVLMLFHKRMKSFPFAIHLFWTSKLCLRFLHDASDVRRIPKISIVWKICVNWRKKLFGNVCCFSKFSNVLVEFGLREMEFFYVAHFYLKISDILKMKANMLTLLAFKVWCWLIQVQMDHMREKDNLDI